MDYVEDKYIRFLNTRLDKFKNVKSGLYNFRCPYCGDSQKHRNKARGYFFLKKSEYIFKCHNCGIGRSLGNFLKENAVDLYDQFLLEKYRNGTTGKGRYTPNPTYKSAKPNFSSKVSDLQSISELNKKHPAREYLEKRQIPQEKLSSLYYTDRFKTWINSKKPGTFQSLQNDRGRIIIPLIDKEGKWFGVQGRSLLPRSTMRYITIIFDEDKHKVFGLNNVKESEPIYIVEGPIDSLFLDNSVAMVGSDVDPRTYSWSDYIWVYDNEPRNRQIVDRISNSIDRGEKVVIWPQQVTKKDINDMILVGLDPQKIIKQNTYQGIQAKIKLTEWKRV
jgi:hypothetical protein